ncbi:MAG: HlyD family efflux transporter periplasmic adaptor subunit [Chloroflexi bacterium]|nr:HlyD family efflux transporter periplasmic adaptor subunit [Chloroflexota bacterium]
MSTQDVDIDALLRGGRRPRRWIALLLIAAIAAIAVLAWYFTQPEEVVEVSEPETTRAFLGRLTSSVELSGSAEAAQTSALRFNVSGEVDSVDVEVGDEVSRGDIVARLEDSATNRQVETAEVQLELARLRLAELLESPAASRIAASERALATAQAQLVSARLDLDQIEDLPDASTIDAAEQTLANARTQLSSAEQALQQLTASVDPGDLARAQQNVANAAAQLSTAEEVLSDLTDPPTATDIASADQTVANAAAQLSSAQQALEDLTSDPSDAELASAEQALASAASQLVSAEQALGRLTDEPVVADIETARSAAVQARNPVSDAEHAVDNARDALDDAHERFCDDIVVLPEICDGNPPLPESEIELLETKTENSGATLERRSRELINAQRAWQTAVNSYEAAFSNLMAAEARLADLTEPDPEAVEQASETLAAATAALDAAQARLDDLLTPATEDDIFQAEQAVVAATAGLIAAESRREDLHQPADESDVFQAEQAVAAARAGLTAAQATLNDLLGEIDPSDLYQAQQTVAAATANRDAAESRLAELLAPPTDEDILEAQLSLASAESVLKEAQANHDELMAGPTATTIAQQEQNVRLAEITLEQALSTLRDLEIEAPFDGVVEEVNIEPGDLVGPSEVAIVVNTRDQIVIELSVTEAEWFQLLEGQAGVATFDAIEETRYAVMLNTLSRVPTVESGVVTYLVEAHILTPEELSDVEDELAAIGGQGAVTVGGEGASGGVSNPFEAPQAKALLDAFEAQVTLPPDLTIIELVRLLVFDEPIPDGVVLPDEFEIPAQFKAQIRNLFLTYERRLAEFEATGAIEVPLPAPGMTANVTFLTEIREQTVQVVVSAVRQIDGEFFVAVPSENLQGWERVAVQVGESDGERVEILDGLEAGQTLVLGVDTAGIAYAAVLLGAG